MATLYERAPIIRLQQIRVGQVLHLHACVISSNLVPDYLMMYAGTHMYRCSDDMWLCNTLSPDTLHDVQA